MISIKEMHHELLFNGKLRFNRMGRLCILEWRRKDVVRWELAVWWWVVCGVRRGGWGCGVDENLVLDSPTDAWIRSYGNNRSLLEW